MGVGISAVQVGHAADGCYQIHQRLIACAALSGNKAGSSWALDRTPQQRGAPERSRTCRRTDLCLSLCSGPAGFASASFLVMFAQKHSSCCGRLSTARRQQLKVGFQLRRVSTVTGSLRSKCCTMGARAQLWIPLPQMTVSHACMHMHKMSNMYVYKL